ncbi:hypothetical protein ACQEUU_37795 [Nonomuraea sp. CA-218870]|uniref:hypothetical protein n=1 Tax=Nonomuraea sp. CA-218870 TaxID=3239998 RepID=UPI003D8AD881
MATEEDRLAEAAAAYRRLYDELAEARRELAETIVDAARARVPQKRIVTISGYTREHVRRICRTAGIEPEDGDV